MKKKSLFIPFSALLVVAAAQLILVSRMVAFLHIQKTEIGSYYVCESVDRNSSSSSNNNNIIGQHENNNLDFSLYVLPEKLSLNQGHTTNGAAGYGVVLSLASLATTPVLRNDKYYRHHKAILLCITIALGLLVLFILSAFVYVFAVTYLTSRNEIDIEVARNLAGKPYNIDSWTPETWYHALLSLPLHKADFSSAYAEMVMWRWWLLLYLFVSLMAFYWTAIVYYKEGEEVHTNFEQYWDIEVDNMKGKSSPL